jgi:transposase-like protein
VYPVDQQRDHAELAQFAAHQFCQLALGASAESWKTLLRDLKRRGLAAPVVAVGDGALGFWAAAREVWPETRAQGCWCHKLANVLDKLPQAPNRRTSLTGKGISILLARNRSTMA